MGRIIVTKTKVSKIPYVLKESGNPVFGLSIITILGSENDLTTCNVESVEPSLTIINSKYG